MEAVADEVELIFDWMQESKGLIANNIVGVKATTSREKVGRVVFLPPCYCHYVQHEKIAFSKLCGSSYLF